MDENGVLTLSIEVELAWGLKEGGYYLCLSKERKRETEILESILELCEQNKIPITFDFVGHLLLEKCDGDHNHGHQQGWFDEDPASDVDKDPLWYAPDLLDRILDSEVEHEIATHTFSHLWVDEISPEVLRWELEKVNEIHDKLGIKRPVSMVAPQNRVPPYEPLRVSGIKVLRRCPEDKVTSSKIKMLWNDLFSESPHEKPVLKDGILESYGDHRATLTANYLPHGRKKAHPFYRFLPISKEYWVERQKKKLRHELRDVITQTQHIHLWSHLWEMSNRWQMEIFEDFVGFIGKQENLKVKTMRELWEDFNR
ncbi:MAG: polysaccharide deacetylase family protein [Candidatus Thermoplasmatota archaeon]|nr:polysaccharide deacetylase family protein [Candidatus Thermoplasmatota archaeon]MBS3790059.1 polysaccharide deacetylase family protein [Candidatus Thermoplasmatota archaeon]